MKHFLLVNMKEMNNLYNQVISSSKQFAENNRTWNTFGKKKKISTMYQTLQSTVYILCTKDDIILCDKFFL